jgi:iron complex transport system permease protein
MKIKVLEKKPIYILTGLVLLAVLIFSLVAAVTIGSVYISVWDVYAVILHHILPAGTDPYYEKGAVHDIVWLLRLPRLILAIVVGMGLAVCGVIMQAIIKNPLADPYILGISSGASLGATVAILWGVGAFLGTNYVGVCAFIGALILSLAVLFISNIGGRSSSVKLLLSGMALSSVCSAFSGFIVFFANNKEGIQSITYWLMGSLAGAKWEGIAVIFPIVLLSILFFWTQSRILNLMLLGDEVSITLGTDLHAYRQGYLLVSALIVGFVVYSAGMIGFVGLLIPHIVRIFFGTDHKKLIPICALVGGLFLIWADVLCRIIIPKTELPIGMLISLVGAPFFVYLMIKRTYGFGGSN